MHGRTRWLGGLHGQLYDPKSRLTPFGLCRIWVHGEACYLLTVTTIFPSDLPCDKQLNTPCDLLVILLLELVRAERIIQKADLSYKKALVCEVHVEY